MLPNFDELRVRIQNRAVKQPGPVAEPDELTEAIKQRVQVWAYSNAHVIDPETYDNSSGNIWGNQRHDINKLLNVNYGFDPKTHSHTVSISLQTHFSIRTEENIKTYHDVFKWDGRPNSRVRERLSEMFWQLQNNAQANPQQTGVTHTQTIDAARNGDKTEGYAIDTLTIAGNDLSGILNVVNHFVEQYGPDMEGIVDPEAHKLEAQQFPLSQIRVVNQDGHGWRGVG